MFSVQGNWPNTYAFTKAITENMISTNEYHLPISIFRPSIGKGILYMGIYYDHVYIVYNYYQ